MEKVGIVVSNCHFDAYGWTLPQSMKGLINELWLPPPNMNKEILKQTEVPMTDAEEGVTLREGRPSDSHRDGDSGHGRSRTPKTRSQSERSEAAWDFSFFPSVRFFLFPFFSPLSLVSSFLLFPFLSHLINNVEALGENFCNI